MLDYKYFRKHKMIAIDLIKKQALDTDSKAIQQINFTGNLNGNNNRLNFSLLKKWKKQRNGESIANLFYFNIISV